MTVFCSIFCLIKLLIIPVSSPIEIYLAPDAIIFSTNVEPHLGTPIIKIGFIL